MMENVDLSVTARQLIRRAREFNQQSMNEKRNETIRELLVELGVLLPYQRDAAVLGDANSFHSTIGRAAR